MTIEKLLFSYTFLPAVNIFILGLSILRFFVEGVPTSRKAKLFLDLSCFLS